MSGRELWEADRLASLHSYRILDTADERAFDVLCRAAAAACGAPIAMINLLDEDRLWAKARVGSVPREMGREVTLCTKTVARGGPFVVPDVRAEPCLHGHPIAHSPIVAYAGVPLVGRDGLPIGTLCVLDHACREFDGAQIDTLQALADQVMVQLDLRRHEERAGYVDRRLHSDARSPARLRAALDGRELVPHYQPVVDMVTGQILGFEALLRWQHPSDGLLPPAAFLPALAGSGMMTPITRAVVDHALTTRRTITAARPLPPDFKMGVNVTPTQAAEPTFAEFVFAALAAHRVAADGLLIELTEVERFTDLAAAKDNLRALVDAGVLVFLDDFGAGWSNLKRTLELPLSGLKVDGSLVAASEHDPRATSLLRGAFSIASEAGLLAVAEGVETAVVRDQLVALGFRYGQGWFYGRPTAAEQLPDRWAEGDQAAAGAETARRRLGGGGRDRIR